MESNFLTSLLPKEGFVMKWKAMRCPQAIAYHRHSLKYDREVNICSVSGRLFMHLQNCDQDRTWLKNMRCFLW